MQLHAACPTECINNASAPGSRSCRSPLAGRWCSSSLSLPPPRASSLVCCRSPLAGRSPLLPAAAAAAASLPSLPRPEGRSLLPRSAGSSPPRCSFSRSRSLPLVPAAAAGASSRRGRLESRSPAAASSAARVLPVLARAPSRGTKAGASARSAAADLRSSFSFSLPAGWAAGCSCAAGSRRCCSSALPLGRGGRSSLPRWARRSRSPPPAAAAGAGCSAPRRSSVLLPACLSLSAEPKPADGKAHAGRSAPAF